MVQQEKPELEIRKKDLQQKFSEYELKLRNLENFLLERLSNAPPDILSDVKLIESLEETKQTSMTTKEVSE